MKSWTFTSSGWPFGRHSRPPLRYRPTNSFFFVSIEATGWPRVVGDSTYAHIGRLPNTQNDAAKQYDRRPPC